MYGILWIIGGPFPLLSMKFNVSNRDYDENCPICLEKKINTHVYCPVLDCGHSFHLKCLVDLINKLPNCPVCCKELSEFSVGIYNSHLQCHVKK